MYLGNQPDVFHGSHLFIHRTMASSQFYIVLVFGLHVISSNTKPVNEWKNGK